MTGLSLWHSPQSKKRVHHFSAGRTPSPAAIHSFHEVSQLWKTASTIRGLNRSVPKAITAEMSSYRKSAPFRRAGRTPPGVEGQQQSHCVGKEEWQVWKQLWHCHMLLLGRCCHVTVCQIKRSEVKHRAVNRDGDLAVVNVYAGVLMIQNRVRNTKCGLKPQQLENHVLHCTVKHQTGV